MLLYIATRLPGGFGDHVPCEYFQNNGVTWCIHVYFEDVCLRPFSFLFMENTDIEYPYIAPTSLQTLAKQLASESDQLTLISCNNFQQKIASESIMKVYGDTEGKFLKFKLLCDNF